MFIRVFSEINKEDVSLAGGKGASLGEMTQVGIPVPPGFVILAETFDTFLNESNLKAEIDAALDTVNLEAVHTAQEASEKIQAMIMSASLPPALVFEIEQQFKTLGAEFVAVRSSATAEDGVAAAWAGQLETYTNITKDQLTENVKKCWASLFTPRAIFYRLEQGFKDTSVSVAVVVQIMVQSEVSGVAFSVHPVTQDSNQLIIEAAWGLGEAVVSGAVTPDSYVVDKDSWKMLDIHASEQEKMLVKKPEGGDEWVDIETERQKAQKLSEGEIVELSKLIVDLENHYGFPVDVEWLRKDGKYWIIQSRPITTL